MELERLKVLAQIRHCRSIETFPHRKAGRKYSVRQIEVNVGENQVTATVTVTRGCKLERALTVSIARPGVTPRYIRNSTCPREAKQSANRHVLIPRRTAHFDGVTEHQGPFRTPGG
jgi:hypothetical protein